MQKTKILFIVPSVYPQVVGGTEVFNYYIIRELGKEYDVTYLNVDNNFDEGEIKNAKRKTIKNTSQFVRLIQIIIYLVKNRKNYDLIWTSFSRTAWYYIVIYPLLNIVFSKKYLIVIHGGGLMPWKFKFPYQLYFKRAKAIIGVSDIICKEYNRRTDQGIIHIPPLIPFQKASDSKESLRDKYKIGRDKKVFLYVGSLKELKRPDVIVEAFSLLGKEFIIKNKVLMIFAGDGIMKNQIIKSCQKEGLEEFLHFLGNIPREKINEYYKLADYYIISSDFEGTPISMLEAMYNNLPIIASDVRGINSVIDIENGILFNNKESQSLFYAIKKLLHDPDFAKLISENAFNYYSKEFSYNTLIENYKKLI